MQQATRPDVLVLAGGGVLGEAWMTGVLAGIEDSAGHDMRAVESFVGTSAGAIVAARLAAGVRPRRPKRRSAASDWEVSPSPTALEVLAQRVPSNMARAALTLERIPGGVLRAGLLGTIRPGTRDLDALERSLERDGAEFDGRLRVVAVERRSGRRVVFGSPGAPLATVPRAVAASCAIPGYFRPVRIGGREYVDGGAWSQTNLDVAPAWRATEILCLNPIHGLRLALGSPMNAMRAVLRTRQSLELAALRRRGARVRVIGPEGSAALAPMGGNLMDRSHADAVLAGGYEQGLRLGALNG